ncbi:MAG: hypothetical protein GWP06_18625, partial [Actinobacteria bacterium]|nr:hypothetical protein [Actinomycetota bacterium]
MNKTKLFFIFLIITFSIMFIRGVSFSAECLSSKFQFDIKPNADQPSDISIGPNGDVYIVDGVNNRI